VIQHHPEEFLRQFKTLLISRKIFELMKRHDDECLTDIHRAVKWFYLLRIAFGVTGPIDEAFLGCMLMLPGLLLEWMVVQGRSRSMSAQKTAGPGPKTPSQKQGRFRSRKRAVFGP
jgi:hypothetical protein